MSGNLRNKDKPRAISSQRYSRLKGQSETQRGNRFAGHENVIRGRRGVCGGEGGRRRGGGRVTFSVQPCGVFRWFLTSLKSLVF